MVCQRKRRRPEDADARDGNRYNRNGLAMKRLISAERRFPRLIAREGGNMDTIQGVRICEHRSDTDKRKGP
jgi:hypothetical protein